jgi:hypothetical protein
MRSIPGTSGRWPLRLFQGLVVSLALCFLGLGLTVLDRSDGPARHHLAIGAQQVEGASPTLSGDEKLPVLHHWVAFIEGPVFVPLAWSWQPRQGVHEGGLSPLRCAPKTSPPSACC